MSKDILLTKGSRVLVHGVVYEITHSLDLSTLVGIREDNGERAFLNIADIQAVGEEKVEEPPFLFDATPDQIAEAKRILAAIQPLMAMPKRRRADVEKVANDMAVDPATVYRWMKRFKRSQTLAALIREKPDGGRGGTRIHVDVEKIIKHYIENEYLTEQKPRDHVIVDKVIEACKHAGFSVHPNTVRNRLRSVPGRLRAERRGDVRALEKHTPTPGKFPNADFPLQVVQIDHTQMDIEIVDDEFRMPIGRPWITVAIDVYSRVVTGFVVSLEAPSAISVGLVIAHSVLPKENWLAARNIDHKWPVYGKIGVIHADNGPDFRCEAVTLGCQNNLMDIHWRLVKKPRYGAHIERLMGTIGLELKTLPGATFSNPAERGRYDSSKNAVFTLREIEYWVAEFLVGKYNNRPHSSLNKMPPVRHYEEGIYGTKTRPGRGVPPIPSDPRRLLIDFLPYEERTVQPDGITIDNVTYYSRALYRWVGSTLLDGKTKRKFRCHQDPRGISPVFFYNDDDREYVEVPYADLSRPVISKWELDAASKLASEKGMGKVDEDAIFRAVANMRRTQAAAAEKTKQARRNQQRAKARAESLDSFPTAEHKPMAADTVNFQPEPPRRRGTLKAFEIEEADA